MQQLQAESSIVKFSTAKTIGEAPPEAYTVHFLGRGLWKEAGSGRVLIREEHEVSIQLGASYPRAIPELTWRTPFYHPNVSASGIVCLGGYSTHWVPSLGLDHLCEMLWDMIRYHNFDTESPYNREAAHWVKTQREYRFPLDGRPIRDRVAKMAPSDKRPPVVAAPLPSPVQEVVFIDPRSDGNGASTPGSTTPGSTNGSVYGRPVEAEIIDAEIVEAELVEPLESRRGGGSEPGGSAASDDPDILFID